MAKYLEGYGRESTNADKLTQVCPDSYGAREGYKNLSKKRTYL